MYVSTSLTKVDEEPIIPTTFNGRAFAFDIDVPRPTTVAGALTVSGTTPPTTAVEWGRVLLRDRVTGDEVPLGNARDGEYSTRVAPGKYDIHYRSVAFAVGLRTISTRFRADGM